VIAPAERAAWFMTAGAQDHLLEVLLATAVAFALQAIDAGQRELASTVRFGLTEGATQVGEQCILIIG